MEANVNTSSERIPAYNHPPQLETQDNSAPLQYLRINLPQSQLTPQQLTRLAGMIRRYSPRHALRLRSATRLEIALVSTHQPHPLEQVFDPPEHGARIYPETSSGHSALRLHVRGAQLHVRQLRVLAALMYLEGIRTVRVADSETLLLENIGRGREAVLRIGLREAGLIAV